MVIIFVVLLLSRNKFLAVEITTTVRHIAVEAPLGRTEGLPQPCVANCDKIRTVPRAALTERAGRLARAVTSKSQWQWGMRLRGKNCWAQSEVES